MEVVGVFINLAETDPDVSDRKAVFERGLGNTRDQVRLEYRYGGGDFNTYREKARQLVALNPRVIFSGCGPSWQALEFAMNEASREIDVVFAGMIDPTPARSLLPRGANHVVTGFISYRADLCRKWPALLKRMKPQLENVAVLSDPGTALGTSDPGRRLGPTQLHEIETEGLKHGLPVEMTIDITLSESAFRNEVARFANTPNGGMIVPGATLTASRRDLIAELASKHKLPAIYPNRMYTTSGGLMSYGAKTLKLYESAAELVATLLRGGSNALPGPTHRTDFELVINLNAADAIGLTVPKDLLDEADHVINRQP